MKSKKIRSHKVAFIYVGIIISFLLSLLLIINTNKTFGEKEETITSTYRLGDVTSTFTVLPSGTNIIQTLPSLNAIPTEFQIYANSHMESENGIIYFTLFDEGNNIIYEQELPVSDHNGQSWIYSIRLDSNYIQVKPRSFQLATSSDAPKHPFLSTVGQQNSKNYQLTLNSIPQDFNLCYVIRGIKGKVDFMYTKVKTLCLVYFIVLFDIRSLLISKKNAK